MISDFVKGSAQFSFSGNIHRGIVLHRMIDEYTDQHEVTKKAKEIFRPYYRLYSGAIMDVLYDHFLANDPSLFSEASLKKFSEVTYTTLEEYSSQLPQRFLFMFTYMKTEDWLAGYRYKDGIRKSLHGLVRRSAFLKESTTAYNLFLHHYVELNEYYSEFFADVKLFAKQKLEELIG